MKMKLRNKNVLIFGGGSGIGKAIAVRFIEAGAKVMITGRTEEKLKAVAEEIAELAFYLMSDFGEIICGHTVVADGGDNCATL